MKKYWLIFSLGLIFFIATSLYSYSSICCMFSASRYFGWPYPYLSLQKTVDTLKEANLVKTDSVSDLVKNDWQFHFAGDMLNSSPLGQAGNLIVDILICFVGAYILVLAGKKIFYLFK